MPDSASPHGAGPAAVPAPPAAADESLILRVAGGSVLVAIGAVLGWSLLWDVTGSELFADAVRGAAAGAAGGLLGWLATDRGRWNGWGAVVITLGAGLPAAAAMILLTRRVDPSLVEQTQATWTIAPLLFVGVALRSARKGSGPSDRIPADAWLAATVAAAVVVACSFGILNTVGRPATAAELVCASFEDWSAARAVTSSGSAEIVKREEFFTMAIEVAPTPDSIERVNRMLELVYRVEAAMSPGGGLSDAAELEQTLRAEMAGWRTAACSAPS